jgi:predicted 2-oxoglutarate/Fe(II)-dependent dioxygenase YbiX
MEIAPGDKMPFCYGMAADRQFYSFEAQAGRAALLIVGGGPGALLDACLGQLAALEADLVLLMCGNPAEVFGDRGGIPDGLRVVDCAADFLAACAAPCVMVIDRAARLVARWPSDADDPVRIAAAAVAAIGTIGREPAHDSRLPAPVLLIPNLLDATLCGRLIERFESGASFESGVTGAGADALAEDRVDHRKKRRRDCLLQAGDALHDEVLRLLFRRCVPDLRKAFQHEVRHTDRLLVARYDETGGYFHRHRDNASASVAFRQFALTVNLNAGEYEGGQLLFPEFNDHRYAPPTGGGIVFSSSLLHAATPVTRGKRYALLTFLHDEAAEMRRQAYRETVTERLLARPVTPMAELQR